MNGQGGKTEREQSEETHASLLLLHLLLLLLLSGTDPAVLTISQVLDWNKPLTDQFLSLLDSFLLTSGKRNKPEIEGGKKSG